VVVAGVVVVTMGNSKAANKGRRGGEDDEREEVVLVTIGNSKAANKRSMNDLLFYLFPFAGS